DLVHLQGLWQHDWAWMPSHIPRWAEELKALAVRQGDPSLSEFELGGHHALQDARCNRLVRRRLDGLTGTQSLQNQQSEETTTRWDRDRAVDHATTDAGGTA